jgi:hypothetical protein
MIICIICIIFCLCYLIMIQARQLVVLFVIIAIITIISPYFVGDTIENAATSPATLIQLSASSTTPLAYPPLRPVLQRGVHFHAPSWHR